MRRDGLFIEEQELMSQLKAISPKLELHRKTQARLNEVQRLIKLSTENGKQQNNQNLPTLVA